MRLAFPERRLRVLPWLCTSTGFLTPFRSVQRREHSARGDEDTRSDATMSTPPWPSLYNPSVELNPIPGQDPMQPAAIYLYDPTGEFLLHGLNVLVGSHLCYDEMT